MTEEYVIFNGKLVAGREAGLSVFDRGLLYGDGFFETLRVEHGQALFLKAHLERLYKSCEAFNIALEAEGEERWTERISQLVARNNLKETIAAVKVVVTRGPEARPLGLPREGQPTIIVYARRYEPPPRDKYVRGLEVEVFTFPRHCLLADHKSLNYLFYLSAREWARQKGADEALVLNVDGTVSEGATTNVFYAREGMVFRPESPHYLRGVMEAQVITLLEEQGQEVLSRPTTVSMLVEAADEVFLTNSLLGVIPVARMGKNVLPSEKPLASRLQGIDWLQRSHANRNS